MSAIDNARAALAEWDSLSTTYQDGLDLSGVLRDLIADHERLSAEVNWEYGAQHAQGINACRSRKDAEKVVAEFKARDHRLRPEVQGRVKLLRRRKAGPWQPMPTDHTYGAKDA